MRMLMKHHRRSRRRLLSDDDKNDDRSIARTRSDDTADDDGWRWSAHTTDDETDWNHKSAPVGNSPSGSLGEDYSSHNPPLRSLRPRAGSSTLQILQQLDEDDDNCSLDRFQAVPEEESHSVSSNKVRWRSIPGERLAVRSLDYQHSRAKTPSEGELYECCKVDFVESSQRLSNMSSRVELPPLNDESVPWAAPELFVVTLSLPRDHNGDKESGPSYTICMYFSMKPETRRVLEQLHDPAAPTIDHPHVPAIRLFDEWCRRSPDDPRFQGRFKLIPKIQNMDDLGLPSWISRWNGKPILIKRSGKTGFLYQHGRCLEFEISFHPFPWAAKQAFEYLLDHVMHRLLMTFGFVIEGREASELPETLIGLCQLCFPQPENVIPAHEFFASDRVTMRSLHAGKW